MAKLWCFFSTSAACCSVLSRKNADGGKEVIICGRSSGPCCSLCQLCASLLICPADSSPTPRIVFPKRGKNFKRKKTPKTIFLCLNWIVIELFTSKQMVRFASYRSDVSSRLALSLFTWGDLAALIDTFGFVSLLDNFVLLLNFVTWFSLLSDSHPHM